MTGFELKFRDKKLSLPLDAITVITRQKKTEIEETTISTGLYDATSCNSVNWLKSELVLGDEIVINVRDIAEISHAVEVYNFHESMGTTKEESDKRTFERFLVLKKELEKENLI